MATDVAMFNWSIDGFEADSFKIYLDGREYDTVDKTEYKIEGLTPDTDYTVKVEATLENGDVVSDVVDFYTRPQSTQPAVTFEDPQLEEAIRDRLRYPERPRHPTK